MPTIQAISINGNICTNRQGVSNGIINISGNPAAVSTVRSFECKNNAMMGVTATNNRGFRSTSAQVFSAALICDNISDADYEMTTSGASVVVARNNIGTVVILPGNTLCRSLPNATAAPVTGAYRVGDVVYTDTPVSAGYIGFVCTVAGSPGTWNSFGLIS